MTTSPSNLQHFVDLGAPILFSDTCSVLDLIRDPTRDTVQAHNRAAALEIVEAMESNAYLIGFLAEQVVLELNENRSSVEDEASKALKQLRDRMRRMDDVNKIFGGNGITRLSHFDDHVPRSIAILDRWISLSKISNASPGILALAFARVNKARTPARKGNQAAKDCLVVETYLQTARQLRELGLNTPFVFLSSNTRDYARETGNMLKADIQSDFDAVGMEYAPNFGAARHLLGL